MKDDPAVIQFTFMDRDGKSPEDSWGEGLAPFPFVGEDSHL